jgi:hypothetical protein
MKITEIYRHFLLHNYCVCAVVNDAVSSSDYKVVLVVDYLTTLFQNADYTASNEREISK